MSELEITEKFLAEIAGWEVMKQARALAANDRVLSGNWSPPVLKGVVQTEAGSLRSGLVIKSKVDIENVCPCRSSREWGMMCAHSVGVGLHVIQRAARREIAAVEEKSPTTSVPETSPSQPRKQSVPRRVVASGETSNLALWLIFPPQWRDMLGRGKVTIFFEGETDGKRRPLNAVPVGTEYRVSEQDFRLFEQLEELTGGECPAMWPFDVSSLAELLPALAKHPRLSVGRKAVLTVSNEAWVPQMSALLQDDGELRLSVGEDLSELVWIPGRSLYVATDEGMRPMGLPASCSAVLQGSLNLPRPQVPEFLQACGAFLVEDRRCETNFVLEDFEFVPSAPAFSLSLMGGLAQLRARIECTYGSRVFTLGQRNAKESVWVPDPEARTRYTTRDPRSEDAALNRLLRYGFRGPDETGWYELRGQDAVLDFFAREYPRLQREWDVSMDERLERSTEKNLERVQPQFELRSSGIEWLDFRVDYASDAGSRFSDSEIQQWLLSGRAHRKLGNGKVAMLDTEAMEEFKEVLQDCSPDQRDGSYRIGAAQAGFLDGSIRDLGWEMKGDTNWRDRWQSLAGQTAPSLEIGDLDSVLRDYQKQGVAWLNFLSQGAFGGILADEMGLGKTLQILALLRAKHLKNGKGGVKALVICPTSLVYNWVAEAERFVPELSLLSLQGARRKTRFGDLGTKDITITSYALIRRDLEHYQKHEFDWIILDEAQHIKNRETQNAKAVKAIRGSHRFVLTGTPMENSVLDLWSIFDFLMPGYLGSATDFKDRYEAPIVKEKSTDVMARLGRRLRPFVLRRTKTEVAPELPEKLEQTVLCPLTSEQREVYAQVMDVSRREVLSADDASGGQQRMAILNALMRLRQICCDLRLLKLPESPREASGKLAMFQELLAQVIDGNHRVLVFSQFVSMLHLIREHLAEQEIEFCYLDGSTKNRGAEVDRFQKSTIPVFLISLKAGGVGLNLTGADTVIHFDPWWNPAIEDQATGRAHRIGQSRLVTSYKLISEDTVEQKILQLQDRKREIIEGTLGSENQFGESLNMDDFRALFED